jgi:hypothetical protein
VILSGHADFRNLYAAGYMVRVGHGHEIYNYAAQKTFQDALVSREEVAIPLFGRPIKLSSMYHSRSCPFAKPTWHFSRST